MTRGQPCSSLCGANQGPGINACDGTDTGLLKYIQPEGPD
jgi:hypothetical protein